MSYSSRLQTLRSGLRRLKCDALVVSNLTNVRYLCGFTGTSGMVVVTPQDAFFITDFRYQSQAAQQVDVIAERQVRMQAVDDVDLGERLIGTLTKLVEHLIERQRVCVGVARLEPRKRAEQAAGHADVGGLEAQVVVVKRQCAVPPLTLAIREPSERVQIGAGEQTHAILEGQTLAGGDPLRHT